MVKKKAKKTKGPIPDRLQIEGDWVDAVGKAIKKKRPEDGWPDLDEKTKPRNKPG